MHDSKKPMHRKATSASWSHICLVPPLLPSLTQGRGCLRLGLACLSSSHSHVS